MEPFRTLISRTLVLPMANVDTDQIIPARFLTVTTKEGLGDNLFADWRRDPAFVLNRPDALESRILVAGENFGCGSSREHAPWALLGFGFRAVVSRSIADIFKGNAMKNGLLPVEVDAETHEVLLASPGSTVEIDLEQRRLVLPDGRAASFPIPSFARHCLLNGIDELDFIRQQSSAIDLYESSV
jgi:3-isopropylmalate/(R)-2-methylmalate dehydratase small subunit